MNTIKISAQHLALFLTIATVIGFILGAVFTRAGIVVRLKREDTE